VALRRSATGSGHPCCGAITEARSRRSATRARGVKTVLDFTSGHPRAYQAIMTEAEALYPDFVDGAPFHIPSARVAREDAECAAADLILTGSEFAAGTLRTYVPGSALGDRLGVLPYCYDEGLFGVPPARDQRRDGPIRFLSIGQASLRKGTNLALEAIARIPPSAATLTIVGSMAIPPTTFARYADRVDYRPSVPRSAIPGVMANADVLLAPSYFEGSSLVLLEALASGLAIIQSRNAGNGATPATGLVLPEQTAQSVYSAMLTLIDDRSKLRAMQAAAPAEALRYRFSAYRENIGRLLAGLDVAR
jgi:glycosyltransferase involved in cell wall biosynthesis